MMYYKCFFVCLLCFVTDGVCQRVGNPDDTAIIERPCRTYDTNCVREFFAKHAHCKKSYLQVPDPFIRQQDVEYAPRVNVTISVLNQVNNGLNGRIQEFYINRDTDKLVIAVELRNFSQTAEDLFFVIKRRAKEPVVVRAFATVTYPSLTITAVIPNIDNLQLERAESTVFFNTPIPINIINPQAAVSTDPQVQVTLAEFISDTRTNSQELLLSDAAYYIALFIQYKICDFGLRLT